MTTQVANIILYSLTIVCSIIQICISVYIILLMILRRLTIREHRIDYLLYANTYITAMFVGIFFIDMCAYSIYGQIYIEISFNQWWCKIKGYLMYVSGCTFFYTFALQAFYRFCRILYRTKVRLYSFRLYIILSISIWLLSFVQLLPSLLIGDIEYISNDYHCQFAPTSIRGSLIIYSLGFVFPFSVTIFCYIWTMCSIRHQTAALVTINQQIHIHRDLIILKRLVIFLTIVTIVGAPHICLPMIYVITGNLPPWIISLEWFLTVLAIVAVSIILLFITPHLKKLWTGLHAVYPARTIMTTARHLK